jgi:phosphatidylserine/phosphatidylglycerophosphate/cardiolipin synthase-like enzyme
MSTDFITNEQLYKQTIVPVAGAASFVWIGTADIKDLHVHHKGTVQSFLSVLDGKFAYAGSANLTGAGLGIKGTNTRNFESGFITTDTEIIEAIMKQFDEVWMGKYCKNCRRKHFCGDPIL